MPKLLGSDLEVAWVAQVARVAVLIAAAQREWFDMVNHCRKGGQATRIAPLA